MNLVLGTQILLRSRAHQGRGYLPRRSHVLPPFRFRRREDKFNPDGIVDTSSSDKDELDEQLILADAVVLTYARDRPETLSRLGSYWLPELKRLEVTVPIILVGCMRDKAKHVMEHDQLFSLQQQFGEVKNWFECSAYLCSEVASIFYFIENAVLHPTAPLFNIEKQSLKPKCLRALKKIFELCDHDRDNALCKEELNGALSNEWLDGYQVKCFNDPLPHDEILVFIQQHIPDGVTTNGLTLRGFFFLHEVFLEDGRGLMTWAVLMKFGFNRDIRHTVDLLLPPLKQPDQVIQEEINQISTSLRELDVTNLPHPSIPETKAGKSRKKSAQGNYKNGSSVYVCIPRKVGIPGRVPTVGRKRKRRVRISDGDQSSSQARARKRLSTVPRGEFTAIRASRTARARKRLPRSGEFKAFRPETPGLIDMYDRITFVIDQFQANISEVPGAVKIPVPIICDSDGYNASLNMIALDSKNRTTVSPGKCERMLFLLCLVKELLQTGKHYRVNSLHYAYPDETIKDRTMRRYLNDLCRITRCSRSCCHKAM